MPSASLDTAWADVYELPPSGNMMAASESARGVFVRQGSRMAATLAGCMREYHPDTELSQLDVLDFGCGVGRIALPLYFRHKIPSTCCDVDPKAIEYLKGVIPGANPKQTTYDPPMSFSDQSFDIVLSVSVWTHLPEELQMPWLQEIRRILRPGGIALLTTSSYAALSTRRETLKDWSEVTDDDLTRAGFLFLPAGATPGVTGVYGYALHTSEYIRKHWSQVFEVLDQRSSAIENVQDLNILRRA